jgi:hypothetical protein
MREEAKVFAGQRRGSQGVIVTATVFAGNRTARWVVTS